MTPKERTKQDIATEIGLAILIVLLLIMISLPGDWALGPLLEWAKP